MKIISNKNNNQITVGIDIGSSTTSCSIGQVYKSNTKIKLLGIASTPSKGLKGGFKFLGSVFVYLYTEALDLFKVF